MPDHSPIYVDIRLDTRRFDQALDEVAIAMSTPSTHILFLDLETVGTGKDTDVIEVAASLVSTEPDLPVIASWSSPIKPRYCDSLDVMSDHVRDMHTKNGLLAAIEAGRYVAPWAADLAIVDLINKYVPTGRRVPLGGSGVGHFDRPLVDREFPSVAKRLTYWPMDTGVVRRFAQTAGVSLPKAPEKTHRAADCVALAIDEARLYLRLLSAKSSSLADHDPSFDSGDERY